MKTIEFDYLGYTITTDKSRMVLADIHKWLTESSYWAKDIPFETVKTAFEHSYCIAVLRDGRQIGYARLITDYAVFGYLADVFVTEEHRGQGISKQMMQAIFKQDWVQGLRGIKLATSDAHGLYRQFGFGLCAKPENIMEITRPNIYQQ